MIPGGMSDLTIPEEDPAMSSLDPLDVRRLRINGADVRIAGFGEQIHVHVILVYEPWEPSKDQDPLWEQSNALMCVHQMLRRGGVDDV